MQILGLVGRASSGKDTVARMISDSVGDVAKIAFADPLKEFCREVFDWTWAHTDGPLKEVEDKRYPRWAHQRMARAGEVFDMVDCDLANCVLAPGEKCVSCGAVGSYLTPRFAMQTLGTEWGRACYENIWVAYGIQRAKALLTKTFPVELVVISDVRFVNEAKAIYDAGGQVWEIERPDAQAHGGVPQHQSEIEQDSRAMANFCAHTLSNQGSLTDLRALVHSLLTLERRR